MDKVLVYLTDIIEDHHNILHNCFKTDSVTMMKNRPLIAKKRKKVWIYTNLIQSCQKTMENVTRNSNAQNIGRPFWFLTNQYGLPMTWNLVTFGIIWYRLSGPEKLGFMAHESPCSSNQVRQNIVQLVILCSLALYRYTCLSHMSTLSCTCHAPNEIGYGKIGYGQMNQSNKILRFPQVRAESLSEKRKPWLCFPRQATYNLAVIVTE